MKSATFNALFDQHHKIFAGAPEYLRVGNLQHILFVGIRRERVAARRMRREQAC